LYLPKPLLTRARGHGNPSTSPQSTASISKPTPSRSSQQETGESTYRIIIALPTLLPLLPPHIRPLNRHFIASLWIRTDRGQTSLFKILDNPLPPGDRTLDFAPKVRVEEGKARNEVEADVFEVDTNGWC